MSNQVNFVYDIEDDPLDELKHWLFLENVRIKQEKQSLIEEKEKLEKEKKEFEKQKISLSGSVNIQEKQLIRKKELFDKQWKIVEKELRRIAIDKDNLEKEKRAFEQEKERFRQSAKQATIQGKTNIQNTSIFFAGVNSFAALKRRYRDLIKIFHPDNENGDQNILLAINKEFETLKNKYNVYR
ncbi:MAG: hypothetical protein J6L69_06355 [Lachnospiraceae bacterium]|nr:hypothetical protein [Lachnospiraceae bacterium]